MLKYYRFLHSSKVQCTLHTAHSVLTVRNQIHRPTMSSFLPNRVHLGCNVISLSQRTLNYLVIDCIEWVSLMILNLTITFDSPDIWLQREVKMIFQYFIVQIPVRLANKRVIQALMEDIQNKNRFWQVKRSKRLRTDFWWAWPQAAPRKGLQWLIRVNIASLPVLAIRSTDNPPTTPIWPGSQFLQSWDQPLIWRITPPGQLISLWVLWSEEVWS